MDPKKQMDDIYRARSLEEIPWNLESPPELLVRLVDSGRILPCSAADFGCGAGNYAVWLAARGFSMTGFDLSPVAIGLARDLARRKGVSCRFLAADVTGDMKRFETSFDFAYDWEVLHHVFPEKRSQYAASVHHMLRPGARYLSVCFSEDDAGFGGEGKYR
ncbi:MAG: class I SAM-dependent methyltransferase [Acidobacteriota bacterium]